MPVMTPKRSESEMSKSFGLSSGALLRTDVTNVHTPCCLVCNEHHGPTGPLHMFRQQSSIDADELRSSRRLFEMQMSCPPLQRRTNAAVYITRGPLSTLSPATLPRKYCFLNKISYYITFSWRFYPRRLTISAFNHEGTTPEQQESRKYNFLQESQTTMCYKQTVVILLSV